MNKFIVTTTINKPTKALRIFSKLKDWKLIVVLDKKSPEFKLKNAIVLNTYDQEKISKKLSDLIGWNCIQRRNFGLLKANQLGADLVATIDDDNIPFKNWGKNLSFIVKKVKVTKYMTKNYFDPISVTNYKNLWHRGYPIQLLNERKIKKKKIVEENFDIKADFWNGDPDIDAICRMEHSPDCKFKNLYFPFTGNKISPFNSQNTFLNSKVLKDYFLFPWVGRMDDIWASYYVQAKGYKVFYDKASVFQKRNIHDLTIDFEKEIMGYKFNLKLLNDITKSPDKISAYLPYKSMKAFDVYRRIID